MIGQNRYFPTTSSCNTYDNRYPSEMCLCCEKERKKKISHITFNIYINSDGSILIPYRIGGGVNNSVDQSKKIWYACHRAWMHPCLCTQKKGVYRIQKANDGLKFLSPPPPRPPLFIGILNSNFVMRSIPLEAKLRLCLWLGVRKSWGLICF